MLGYNIPRSAITQSLLLQNLADDGLLNDPINYKGNLTGMDINLLESFYLL